ncbi:WYL domain-containing protein [Virgibacillus dakarensis]|nr:YafY family transcriptional regulator [Virgibacillus dakarensis]MTW84844.1 WYL domain-containing protein [Virgibacillus dakarensis]
MSKTQRLIELMMTVNTKRRFTAKELAAEFGVSYRTMLRDLDELSTFGVPLYSEVGADGGYYVLNDRMLPPVFLKESEAVTLFFAYQSLQFFGSLPFATETGFVLKKFYQYLPEDAKSRIDAMKDRIVFWNPNRAQPAEHLELILESAIDQSALLIDYDGRDGITERTIQPIGLYSYNGFWYCPAFCFRHHAVRLFRADRIKNAVRTKAETLQNLPYKSVIDWLRLSEKGCPDPVPFVIELTREGVRRALSEIDLEHIVKIRKNGTGWIDTEIPKSELTYFVDLIWNFGIEASIKEPPEAVSYIKQKLETLTKHYS